MDWGFWMNPQLQEYLLLKNSLGCNSRKCFESVQVRIVDLERFSSNYSFMHNAIFQCKYVSGYSKMFPSADLRRFLQCTAVAVSD